MWIDRVRLSPVSAHIRQGESQLTVRSLVHRGSRDKAAELSVSP